MIDIIDHTVFEPEKQIDKVDSSARQNKIHRDREQASTSSLHRRSRAVVLSCGNRRKGERRKPSGEEGKERRSHERRHPSAASGRIGYDKSGERVVLLVLKDDQAQFLPGDEVLVEPITPVFETPTQTVRPEAPSEPESPDFIVDLSTRPRKED